MSGLSALAPLARSWRPLPPPRPGCQLCAAPIEAADEEHEHLVDLEQRSLLCVCGVCARIVADGGRYRRVPDRVLVDPSFVLDEPLFASLQLPVRLVFVFFNSRLDRWVALYPSPAGAAETELEPEVGRRLVEAMPLAAAVAPDVEALLIYGRRGGAFETFLVSIDTCYHLVGRVRLHWTGFHGGDAAWREIEAFFTELRARASIFHETGRSVGGAA